VDFLPCSVATATPRVISTASATTFTTGVVRRKVLPMRCTTFSTAALRASAATTAVRGGGALVVAYRTNSPKADKIRLFDYLSILKYCVAVDFLKS